MPGLGNKPALVRTGELTIFGNEEFVAWIVGCVCQLTGDIA